MGFLNFWLVDLILLGPIYLARLLPAHGPVALAHHYFGLAGSGHLSVECEMSRFNFTPRQKGKYVSAVQHSCADSSSVAGSGCDCEAQVLPHSFN